ncbi:MAG TPA: GDSL-type esterase/lipase family protein [Chitinophagaceae bacterium]|nr:GDSL-type esterase/lipase family protein [Chitinophagaceae bacterium]HNF72601.1 GDSL-type esterase/lipase family protein [Chitinophagaceae bacterium]
MKYLALGDSYTIGEQVTSEESFPAQLCRMLQDQGIPATLSGVVAVTGWTTDELSAALAQKAPALDHDWVSLLIGVNNQYRGRSVEEYHWQFYSLLCQAILFAGARPERVLVLSIPDWGLTPFNQSHDPQKVTEEINAFNAVNEAWCHKMGCVYFNITESTRKHARQKEFLTDDLLHYSPDEYAIWAGLLAQHILKSSL